MFRLIAINFSLLSPTSPCDHELSEREVTSPSNLKVVRALKHASGLARIYYINFPLQFVSHDKACLLSITKYRISIVTGNTWSPNIT